MITNPNYRDQYSGDGATSTFAYTFPVTDKTHLLVVVTDANGVDTTLAVDTDYTVNGVGDSTSANWKITYPVSGTILPSGSLLTIIPNLPAVQKTNLDNQGGYYFKTVEAALDYLTVLGGQFKEALARCVSATVGSNAPPSVAQIAANAASAATSATSALASAAAASASALSVNLRTINSQSGNYTIVVSDKNKLVDYTGTGSTFTLTAAATLGSGFEVVVRHSGSGNLVIARSGSDTIDGATSQTLTAGQSVVLISKGGTTWNVTVAKGYGAGTGTVTSITTSGGIEAVGSSPITNADTIRAASPVLAKTADYTIQTADRAKLLTVSKASAVAITLPQAGVNFPSGWFIDVQSTGVGTVTITPTTSTVDGGATVALTQNQGCRIFSDGTNYFTMRGVSGASAVAPTGSVFDYAGASAPAGYLLCDGAAVSRTTYSALFAVVSTTFGVGDGSTTFNVPDARGRVTIGVGTGSGLTARNLADLVGAETHTLTTNEMPSHHHSLMASTGGTGGGLIGPSQGGNYNASNIQSDNTGGGAAHSIMQPSLALTKIIKT